MLAIVLVLSYKRVKDGTLLSTYFIGYGLGRFLIEGLRTDSLYILPGIRVSQMLSLVLIVVGIVLLILIKKTSLKQFKNEGLVWRCLQSIQKSEIALANLLKNDWEFLLNRLI